MRMRLALLLAAVTVSGTASAEDARVLVEERARAELGATVPADANYQITYQPELEDIALLSEFWFERTSGRFAADAVLPTGEVRRIGGLVLTTLMVPVPNRRLMPDEIISETDIDTVELPLARVAGFALTDSGEIVGMQVRRMLAQGRPVMAQSVQAPRLIERGQPVEIKYTSGRLTLSAPGRAMQDGGAGDLVKIVNLSSNKSVTGIAVADGIVEVGK